MTTFRRPCRMTVYICDSAMHQHKPLCDVIVKRAHEAGLSGATVMRGIEGFGRAGDIHTTRILDLSEHLPICVALVDEEEKLRAFAADNADCLASRLVTLEPLELPAGASR